MKRFKELFGVIGYVLETIIIIAFISSLLVLFYIRFWPKEPQIVICDDNSGTTIINESRLININTASSRELQRLNGIGEKRAKAIIEYREENGYFTDIEQIIEVDDITEAIFEKIRDEITV